MCSKRRHESEIKTSRAGKTAYDLHSPVALAESRVKEKLKMIEREEARKLKFC
jgi:hypothetical protein